MLPAAVVADFFDAVGITDAVVAGAAVVGTAVMVWGNPAGFRMSAQLEGTADRAPFGPVAAVDTGQLIYMSVALFAAQAAGAAPGHSETRSW